MLVYVFVHKQFTGFGFRSKEIGRNTSMRIRIQLFNFIRIRSQLFTLIRILIRIKLLFKVMEIHFEPPSLHFDGPSRLYFEPLKLLNFDSNRDPDPAFHSNSNPDTASKNNADQCGFRNPAGNHENKKMTIFQVSYVQVSRAKIR